MFKLVIFPFHKICIRTFPFPSRKREKKIWRMRKQAIIFSPSYFVTHFSTIQLFFTYFFKSSFLHTFLTHWLRTLLLRTFF